MGLDFTYIDGDQPVEDGDYETTTGAWPAMIREMSSEFEEEMDPESGQVVGYGNRMFTQVERGFDSDTERELIKRYYTEVGERYTRTGQIEDLGVIVGDVVGISGVGVHVQAFDVQAGAEQHADLTAWGDG